MPTRTREGRGGRHDQVLVIGLGRFGSRLATTLVELGHEVLGIDADAKLVTDHATRLTKVMEADTTRIEALHQIGAEDFHHVVLGIGDLEASILTATNLLGMGVTDLWAKATTDAHAEILDKLGVPNVVQPERDMGERIAHRVTGKVIDYIELDPGFALVETTAPTPCLGKNLVEAGLRNTYGVTVVCIKPAGQAFTYATADTVMAQGDILLVAGETENVEAFAELD